MRPTQDAIAALRLALQKIHRARRAVDERNEAAVKLELDLAALNIEDAQSVIATLEDAA